MAVKSVHFPSVAPEGDRIRITGDEHHHLVVGRVQPGEPVEVFDGEGRVWTAEVETTSRRETTVRILGSRRVERSGPEIILGLSLIKPAAFELALEKAVEIGVNRICPVLAARSNAPQADRAERWRRIVIEAAKQSKHYHLPVVDRPMRFADILDLEASTKILFAERSGGPLKSALAGAPVLCLVGPEGGWTDVELADASGKGFHLVGLGDGLLRSETAAIIGAALIRYELQNNL